MYAHVIKKLTALRARIFSFARKRLLLSQQQLLAVPQRSKLLLNQQWHQCLSLMSYLKHCEPENAKIMRIGA